jgi:hypothetical protein
MPAGSRRAINAARVSAGFLVAAGRFRFVGRLLIAGVRFLAARFGFEAVT